MLPSILRRGRAFNASYLCRAAGFCLGDAMPWYPAALLPQLLGTLAALADIELGYQSERKQLQEWAGPEADKARFAAQLAGRYQRGRTPCIQRLTELQLLMNRMAFPH